jgi:hypothetical protein
MNQERPIYCIKSRSGRIEKQGDFSEIVGWLKENRISSDDDLRRLGYAVLEKDELWARVKDFPEFNLTEREGRQKLRKANRLAKISIAVGLALFGLGVGLLIWNQVWPRYVESKKVAESQKMAEDAKTDAKDRINKAVAEAEKLRLAAEAEAKDARALKEVADKTDEKARQDVAEMKAKLESAMVDKDSAISQKTLAENAKATALASVQAQIKAKTESLETALQIEREKTLKLSAELKDIRETLPLIYKYDSRRNIFGETWYEFEYLNTAKETLELRFKIIKADGSTLEKTFKAEPAIWKTLDIDGYRFHENDKVGIVPAEGTHKNFQAVVYTCPANPQK